MTPLGAIQAAEAAAIAAEAAFVPLPPPVLVGWEGLCAGEYAVAAWRLRAALLQTGAALTGAAVLLGAEP